MTQDLAASVQTGLVSGLQLCCRACRCDGELPAVPTPLPALQDFTHEQAEHLKVVVQPVLDSSVHHITTALQQFCRSLREQVGQALTLL